MALRIWPGLWAVSTRPVNEVGLLTEPRTR
jgi:hypothetical protein